MRDLLTPCEQGAVCSGPGIVKGDWEQRLLLSRVLVRHDGCWSSCTRTRRDFDREECSHDHVVGCIFGCGKGTLHWMMASACVLCVGLRVGSCFTQQLAALSRPHITRTLAIPKRNLVHFASTPHFVNGAVLRHTQRNLPLILAATVIAGSTLGISSLTSPSTPHCDGKCTAWMIHSLSPDNVYFKTYRLPELVPPLQRCL